MWHPAIRDRDWIVWLVVGFCAGTGGCGGGTSSAPHVETPSQLRNASAFDSEPPTSPVDTLQDRLLVAARKLQKSAVTETTLDEYRFVCEDAVRDALALGLDEAESVVQTMQKTLLDLRPASDVASRVADLQEQCNFYQRLIDARRQTFAALHARLTDHPDDVEAMLIYEVKLPVAVSAMREADPESAAATLRDEREFLSRLESMTRSAKVRETAEGLLKSTIPHLERQLARTREMQSLLAKSSPPLDVDAWLNVDPAKEVPVLKGKVVLLDFWAVWCGPCVASFPKLLEWRREFREEDVAIIGVTGYYDFEWDEKAMAPIRSDNPVPHERELLMLERFIDRKGLSIPIAVDRGSTAKSYQADSLPTLVVVDRHGKIRLVRTGNSRETTEAVYSMIKVLIAESPD